MDVRLTDEHRALKSAAAKLADDLGPGSVLDLDDESRKQRLNKAVDGAGWRTLRSDGASGVDVAIVAEEFGRGLVDVAFLGPVLADDAVRHTGSDPVSCTVVEGGRPIDASGAVRAVAVADGQVRAGDIGALDPGVDLTRIEAASIETGDVVGSIDAADERRWRTLATVATVADLVGTARGALDLAVDYAKVREQYGRTIGSNQAVAHLLAEALALVEGSVSVLRYAAWGVDELAPDDADRAARIAKVYCARTARTVCETSIQVHGGIGNTWECLAHVYLRRALHSTELFPVRLEEISLGLS